MAKSDLTPDELLAAIEAEEKSAYGFYLGELSAQREQALDYYLGEGFEDDDLLPDGRSKAVSTDVADTIEWVLPSLLKIFMAGDDVVVFNPIGMEDEEQAEQETAFINHVITQKNDGFATFYSWFKDALISKTGYVKVWYEEKEDVTKETYEGLADEEFAMLLQDDDVEPIAHTERVEEGTVAGPDGMPVILPVKYHDVTLRRVANTGKVKVACVPPEEVFVSVNHTEVSLKDAPFVEHRRQMTISSLREMGYKVSDDISDETDRTTEEQNRDQYGEWKEDNEGVDSSMRLVWVRDVYIRIDKDKDGIAELRRILIVGKTILEDEETELIPFAALCPVPMPHRHVGLSYADLIMDLQQIKSMLLRGVLDNVYLANNGRYAISDRVNLSDMLVSRPGGVVRVDGEPGSAIMPLTHSSMGQAGMQMMEYIDSIKENRTGVTKYNQGLDSNTLNKTAAGISQIMGAAQERIALVARIFAEGGVKDLFLLIHALVLKHEKKEQIFRMRNKWVPVDPRQWVTRSDMTISVGLGTGNKDSQLAHLSSMFGMAMQAAQAGVVEPVNVYNLLKRVAINAGFKNPDEFFTDPSQKPPQEPQQDPQMMLEQQKMQMDMQKSQAQMQMEQQKAQAQLQQEQVRSQNDVAIEQTKVQAQMELERWKAELKAQTDIQIAQINAQIKAQEAEMSNAADMRKALLESEIQLRGLVEQAKASQGDEKTGALMQGMQAMIESLNRPKTIIRGDDGRAAGVV